MKNKEIKIINEIELFEIGGIKEVIKKYRKWLLGGYHNQWRYYIDPLTNNLILEIK